MDVSRFRSTLKFDGARPNLFRVLVNLPPALLGAAGSTRETFNNQFSLVARAASIPQSTLGVAIVNYMGREISLAGNRTFSEWTVTVMNDEDYSIRRTFELWMAGINSHVTNVRRPDFASATDYTSECIVEHFGKTGEDNIIATYRMQNAWPTDVSDIQLDWGSNDQVEEYTVTFRFDDWIDGAGSLA
jgi:hypothetical protein